jgi:hypothetical protein
LYRAQYEHFSQKVVFRVDVALHFCWQFFPIAKAVFELQDDLTIANVVDYADSAHGVQDTRSFIQAFTSSSKCTAKTGLPRTIMMHEHHGRELSLVLVLFFYYILFFILHHLLPALSP